MNSLFKSLSFRIWLPFAISISILLISLLVLYPNRQEDLFRKNFQSELNQLTRTTALGVEVALDNSDFENLGQIVELVTNSANLEFVAITEIDSSGNEQVFVSNPQNYDPDKILKLDSANLLVQSQEFSTALIEGRVILAITKEAIDKAIFEINYPIYVFLGILMILSLGLFYGLAKRISDPITYLTEVSNQLKTGNYELDINLVSRVNEISDLNYSLIQLKEYLFKAKLQSEKFNQQLEEQILIRTEDLERTKNRLFEAQRVAVLGNFEVDLLTGSWSNSPIIDQIFEIPTDFAKDVNSWQALLSPANAQLIEDEFYKCKVFNRSFRTDLKIASYRDTTVEKWISISGAPVKAATGDVRFIRGTIQDISDRKAFEKEIEKLSLVAKRTSNCVVITDTELKITWVNDSFLQLTGYSWDEVIGQTPGMFQFEKTDKHTARFIKEEVLLGKNVDAEILNRGKYGNEYWLRLNIVPLREDSGEVTGYMAVEVDITELKKTEIQIQKQVDLQNILIDISATYINLNIEDLDDTINASLVKLGKFVDADRAYIFDYNLKDQTCSNTYEWCNAGIGPEIKNLQHVPMEAIPDWVETHLENRPMVVSDVDQLPIGEEGEMNLRAILEPQGIKSLITIPFFEGEVLSGFVGFDSVHHERVYAQEEIKLLTLFGQMLVNVKQKQKAQRQLIIQEEKYRNIIANMNLGFLEVDVDDVILNANPSFIEMSGFSLDELVGKRGMDLFFDDDLSRKIINQKNILRKTGQSDVYEVEVIDKSGNRRWWLISGGPNYNDAGELIGSVGIHLDITDQKKLQNEQRHLLGLTQNQNERLRNFAHIVSHNLRSHAANLLGMITYLEVEDPHFSQNLLFQNFKNVIDNLMESVQNLSEVADIQISDSTLMESINLVEVINSSILNVSALARSSDVAIKFIPENSQSFVLGNLPYLESITLNLLTNAIKYSDPKKEKKVEIRIRKTPDWTIAEVEDNGLGIDLKRQGRKMFGMYKTFHEHPDSRGIGLFITKNQIEAIGGKIEVESEEGVGTTFKVYLKSNS
jgi:PAS domain S-box-containing protein